MRSVIFDLNILLQDRTSMIDHIMTSTQFVKGRVKNGHVKNGHNLKNFKKICSDIDMDEYVAVGIHEAQPTSNTKLNDASFILNSNAQHLTIKTEKSDPGIR